MPSRTSKYITAVFRGAWSLVVALGGLMVSLLGVLAASAKTSGANDASANAARGGALNYRTGKLDDGTDPTGWYEKD